MESVGWHPSFFKKAVTSCVELFIVECLGSHFPPHAFTAHGVAVEKVIYWLESHLFGFLLVRVHFLACSVLPVHPVHLAMSNRGKAGRTWLGSASHGFRTRCRPISCFPPFHLGYHGINPRTNPLWGLCCVRMDDPHGME